MGLATREKSIKAVKEIKENLCLINRNKKYSIYGREQIELIESMLEWIEDIPKLYDIIDDLKAQLEEKPKEVIKIKYRGKHD